MAFPASKSNLTDNVDDVLADHINNLEEKVGVDSSAVATTLDYLLKNVASVDPGHKHSELWASDGDPQAIDVDAAGIMTMAVQPIALVHLKTTDQVIPNTAYTRVAFNNESRDVGGNFDSSRVTGTTTGTTANKLVDSGASFVAGDVDRWVWNTTDNTYTQVTAVDDANTLSLADDIMTSGESYILYHSHFDCPAAGEYLVLTKLVFVSLADGNLYRAVISKNNGTDTVEYAIAPGAGNLSINSFTFLNCVLNDKISIKAYQNSGGTKSLDADNSPAYTYMAIAKLF